MPIPLVTFCVPVFNAQNTLEQCLRAILDQNLENAEILVVDNASTDDSVSIAEEMLASASKPWGRVVRNETNIGRIENWNRCLDLAGGRFIKFAMASDVLWLKSTERLLAEALANEDVVMVASRHEWWDGSPAPIPSMDRCAPPLHLSSRDTLGRVLDGQNPFWALNGMLIRNDAVRTGALRFEPSVPYVADILFCTRLAALGSMRFLPCASYWFNTGIRSRFHYAGMDAESYFSQYRAICREATEIAKRPRQETPSPETVLFRHYLYCLEIASVPIDLTGVLAVFRGHAALQFLGAFQFFWRRSFARALSLRFRRALRTLLQRRAT